MNWVTIVWSMNASACLTLAAIHLLVWSKNRAVGSSLAFASAAVAVAGIAAGELWMMLSRSPEEFGLAARWVYLPITVLVISLVSFVHAGFRSGRTWLFWSAIGLQVSALLAGFTTGANIVYRDIAALKQIDFLGERVSVVAEAIPNPWIILDQLASLFTLAFIVDGSVRLWRRGGRENRNKAWRIGGSTTAFLLLAAGYSALVDAQLIRSVYLISIPFLGVLIVMALDLSRDVLRAHQLVRELRENESGLLKLRGEQDEQLQFERLVTEISAALMHAPASRVDPLIVEFMGRVGAMLGFEIVVYSILLGDGRGVVPYVWNKPGFKGMPPNLTDQDFPWKARELSAGRDTHIRTLDDFPPEAEVDRATYERYGIKSSFDVSIIVGGQAVGVFSMGSFGEEQAVPPAIIQRQRIVGDLFANAILRSQAEADLSEGKRRLDLAATAADFGLWRWNLKDNTLWATARAREIFGFSPEEEVSFEMWLECLHPEDRSLVEAELSASMTENRVFESEYRTLPPDGEVRWITARGEPALNQDGEPVSVSGVVRDITERKETELETRQLRRDLAHSGRVTLLGQLASALAHELGQPLGAILRNAEAAALILEEDPPDLEELRAIVSDICRDDQRAGEVISRLRALLKRKELELLPVDVSSIISEVVALVQSDILARGVRLEVSTTSGLPLILGDRVHLQQVLLNLIMNAMDAISDSEGVDRHVAIGAEVVTDRRVRVSVGDNGPGIPGDILERIFEPFFTTKSSGMGVGLAVSRSLIEAHHGTLEADNRPDGGAIFRFTVPIASDGDPA